MIQSFKAEAGFSLIEILIALSLFSLIMTLGLYGLTTFKRAYNQANQYQAHIQELDQIHGQVGRWLKHIYAYDSSIQSDEMAYPLISIGDSLTFITPFSLGGPAKKIQIHLDRAQSTLFAFICPDQTGKIDHSFCDKRTLLSGVEDIQIEFSEDFRGQPRTSTRWHLKTTLPNIIKLTFKRAKGYKQIPQLIIAPRIQDQVHCNLDPVSKRCR